MQDRLLNIATGKSRKETDWRNTRTSWSKLKQKLSETTKTTETMQDYLAMSKSRRAEIKDVGGFVAGLLKDGKRKAGHVVSRSCLTLDLDDASPDFWSSFTMMYGCAALVYGTHRFTKEAPHLRLVIPASRDMTPEEYIPVARRIAESMGIEQFDDSTYEPERLMYWPSTPKDVAYYVESQDGDLLDVDSILESYHDYRDSSEWPVSGRQTDVIARTMGKAEDPTAKTGVIGAFCRTYGIHAAIETFLPDLYTPSGDNRYTYTKGTTANGMIVYDDVWSYSHHGTDPTAGKLCNAFDLVRIHLFGYLDENTDQHTNASKYPSFLRMTDLALNDKEVRVTMVKDKLSEAKNDFSDVKAEDENADWMTLLETDRKGSYLSTIHNIRMILENDTKLKGMIRFDQFRQQTIIERLPWRIPCNEQETLWTDSDNAQLRGHIEGKPYRITGVQKVTDAFSIVKANNSFHPVRDYLNSLTWDGTERLDTIFIDYMGADDTPIIRAMSRKCFTAAVARVMNPGEKFDYVTILVGRQGIGKTRILEKMGRQWFSNSFENVDGKEAMEQLRGVWIMEIGELAGLKKSEIESIKGFLSKNEDRYRPAYGTVIESYKRQCVFFGTTNDDVFLRDTTGNRRFWPIKCYPERRTLSPYEDLDDYVIGQIWAEAKERWRSKEPLYLSHEEEEEASKMQNEHTETDDRKGIIEEFVEKLLPEGWTDYTIEKRRNYFLSHDDLNAPGCTRRDRISAVEIMNECFGERYGKDTKYNTREINSILKSLDGWSYIGIVKCGAYGKQRCYERIDKDNSKLVKNENENKPCGDNSMPF